ncbi:MAG: hypothetical protein ACRC62_28070 [Microcoleus sp.]
MADTPEQTPEVTVKVISDRPVNGVYKDGTTLLHPDIAKQFADLELVEIVQDAPKSATSKTPTTIQPAT